MISATHAIYVKGVEEHLRILYGVKLNSHSLKFGAIHPNASFAFHKKYPHYLKDSLDEIAMRVELMTEMLETRKELETKKFSRELGVILHYVADYFCRAHNDFKGIPPSSKRKHRCYERKLHRFVKRCRLEVLREEVMEILDYDLKEIDRVSFKDYVI